MSAVVRRSAARAAASGSSERRTSSRSRASSGVRSVTLASLCAPSSTSPSDFSRRSASRSGVVLIPIVRAKVAWFSTWPGANSPVRIRARSVVYAKSLLVE